MREECRPAGFQAGLQRVTMVATIQMLSHKEIQNQLLEKARKQGNITYDDILALMPDAETDVLLLDDVMDSLMEAGFAVVPNTAHEDAVEDITAEVPMIELEPDDLEAAGEGEDILLHHFDLVEDAGYQQALDTDDVVGLYLKEAGRVPLLTAEEEVSLAKRMERGELAKKTLEEMGDRLPPDDVYELKDVLIDAEMAQEHLIRAN
ncbi:MAG TPA: sigma-70 factor domain-containing protein, partial [Phototrophicaceae bacterium]|nr:sigma-70 factor domain-containing protein [Phototrophicaceae bacterium]